MIQFINVSKVYPSRPKPIVALDNVSFNIEAGEFVFLVGTSGSGKTTVLKHIIREELPDEGRIYFFDHEITHLKRTSIYELRRQIGVVFQDYKLIEEKNAYENIAFAMEAAGSSRNDIAVTVPYVLETVNLTERALAFPSELSGGEKQRVAIARAIATNPKLLIADEPTGNLDPAASKDIVNILKRINEWGTTVIMSTHDIDMVQTQKMRVITMEYGKIVEDSPAGKIPTAQKKEITEDNKTIKLTTTSTGEENVISAVAPVSEPRKSVKEEILVELAPAVPEHSNAVKEIEAEIQELITENLTPEPSEQSQKEVQELLEKADQSPISILKLGKKLETQLVEMGYKDVEDILSAGIAKVNEALNNVQVKQLAKSIKRFLTTE